MHEPFFRGRDMEAPRALTVTTNEIKKSADFQNTENAQEPSIFFISTSNNDSVASL